jgi:tetraprenyl-beta-curcumene synthase
MALILANVRYWTSVAPLVRAQLRHWERRARTIGDPALRALALQNLREEGYTAEAAAMLATLAPRAHRRQAVEAIVALEVMYDYLDGLSERPSLDPLADGERLFGPFMDAIEPDARVAYEPACPQTGGGYLRELSDAVSSALSQLPASGAIAGVARASARRSAQAQIRMHAAPYLGTAQLREWAESEMPDGGLQWRELVAGAASSVICLHALIAAAANERTTPEQAFELDGVYLTISALGTLLDSLIDYEDDIRSGELAFIEQYDTYELFAHALASMARDSATQARRLPDGAHHVTMLVGVVAYFTSAAGADGELARPIADSLHSQLRPLIGPTLAMMRAWRLAKRVRRRTREGTARCARRS